MKNILTLTLTLLVSIIPTYTFCAATHIPKDRSFIKQVLHAVGGQSIGLFCLNQLTKAERFEYSDALDHISNINLEKEMDPFTCCLFAEVAKEYIQSPAGYYFLAVTSDIGTDGLKRFSLFDAHDLNTFIFNGSILPKRRFINGAIKTAWDLNSENLAFEHQDTIEGSEKGLIPTCNPLTRAPLWPGTIYYFSIDRNKTIVYLGNAFDLIYNLGSLQEKFTLNNELKNFAS